MKAGFSVVRHIVKAGSSVLVPQEQVYSLYKMPHGIVAISLVNVPVSEHVAADHKRMIEESVLPLDKTTINLLQWNDQVPVPVTRDTAAEHRLRIEEGVKSTIKLH